MKRLVFDIETDGLNEITINGKGNAVPEGTKVYCLCTIDVDSGEETKYVGSHVEYGVEALRKADLIIGHNILMFDIPFLERLYGVINTKALDTLIVSRLMYPDPHNHPLGGNSLKNWGKHLGEEKIQYDNFDYFCEEMLEYCLQDVKVNLGIFNAQKDFIKKYQKNVDLEHITTRIIAKQIDNGYGFDLDAAEKLQMELLAEKARIDDEMRKIFPPIIEERWSDKTGKRLKDKVTVFNPGSRQQIADRLSNKYGWNPPLTEKGNPKVDAAVLKKLSYPEAKELVRAFDVMKLEGQVADWIKRASASRDGRIHGNVNVQGTVTGRMTASQPNMQQVSGDKRARALFKPKDGWVQVGIDASGLEARMLANRMAPHDNLDYGKIILHDDIHEANRKAAGLTTRDQAKTFFYGLIYGAGNQKIGEIVGKNAYAGGKLKNKFFDNIPAIKMVMDNCAYQVADKKTITLLDGREVPCRSQHVGLNVQLQGDGAIVMKLALCILMNKLAKYKGKYALMATVHDEWQFECCPSIADNLGKLGCEAIKEAGERLFCIMPLDGDYRIGKDWSECH
tara:strand:- start:676 stop:2370 length:1695 start_codon:yes stop_codon:yes gene_type:complete